MLLENTLSAARGQKRWTQQEAARHLGVSQGYLSLLEKGKRRPSPQLEQRLADLYELSPAALPLPQKVGPESSSLEVVAAGLAALGYPGFRHLKPGKVDNPAVVVLGALQNDRLESRLAGALPWVLRTFPNLNWDWLLREAKVRDLQNRLGFMLALAKRAAQKVGDSVTATTLEQVERRVEYSRLVREDVFGRSVLTETEKRWLRTNRPPEAQHWNVLSSLTVEELHA